MLKTVVIYKSKTGYTQKYAEWIAKALSADIFEASQINVSDLERYDAVVFGGSMYAERILGIKVITKNLDKLKDKKIAVFATGLSAARRDVIEGIRNNNFTPEQQKHINFFYLRGGFNYQKLNAFDKFIMNLFKKKIESKKNKNQKLTSDEIEMLAVFNKPTDYTNEKHIVDIVSFIQGVKDR